LAWDRVLPWAGRRLFPPPEIIIAPAGKPVARPAVNAHVNWPGWPCPKTSTRPCLKSS